MKDTSVSDLSQLVILVVDDHETVQLSTAQTLQQAYPDAQILTASHQEEAIKGITQNSPGLLVLDLSIPRSLNADASVDVGLELLKYIFKEHPEQNIVVQSANVKALVRLKPGIQNHRGGFTIADKALPIKEMLNKVDWALQGLVFTPREMRVGLEIKDEWLDVLKLAFHEGLQDKAIAERMNLSERTVRNYWTKVQDALGVYPDDGINIRIQTEIKAREAGLID